MQSNFTRQNFIAQLQAKLPHTATWLLLYIVPITVLHILLDIMFMVDNEAIAIAWLYRVAMPLLVFYIHYNWLVPTFFFQRRYGAYAAWLIGITLLAILLPALLSELFLPPPFADGTPPPFLDPQPHMEHYLENHRHMGDPPPPPPNGTTPFFIRSLLDLRKPLPQLFLVLCAWFLSFSAKMNERYQAVVQSRLTSELAWLKAQINPHFLFNALNSLYVLSIKQSPQTPEAILQLSEMMRYITAEANTASVPIAKELAYINNYIAIQRLRLAPTVDLQYIVTGNPQGKEIAPLILISFIENAFKYGISTTEDSPIVISIAIEEDKLRFHTYNKVFHRNKALVVGAGIGINNTKKRLQLLYAGKHQLTIAPAASEYRVDLTLQL